MLPEWVSHVTGFIDVQGAMLYWMIVGWGEDFSGCVVDYGAYPDPRRAYFTLKEVKTTLQMAHPGCWALAPSVTGMAHPRQ